MKVNLLMCSSSLASSCCRRWPGHLGQVAAVACCCGAAGIGLGTGALGTLFGRWAGLLGPSPVAQLLSLLLLLELLSLQLFLLLLFQLLELLLQLLLQQQQLLLLLLS